MNRTVVPAGSARRESLNEKSRASTRIVRVAALPAVTEPGSAAAKAIAAPAAATRDDDTAHRHEPEGYARSRSLTGTLTDRLESADLVLRA